MRIRQTLLLLLLVLLSGLVMRERFFPKNDDSEMGRPLPILLDVVDAESPDFTQPVSVSAPDAEVRDFSLIVSAEENDVEWTSRTPAARRVRRITPDPSLLSPNPVLQKGDMVELALFEDAVLSLEISRVTRYPNGAVGMTAHLRGENDGIAYLSYSGGELRASIEMPGADDYYIRYNPETDAHYAVQIDRENSDYQEGAEPLIPPADDAVVREPLPVSGGQPVAAADIPSGYPEGSVEIDVMIVYTPAARIAEGGTNGINNNIAQAMEKANEAHINSDTRVYLNWVHSQEIAYVEDGDPGVDLDQLTFLAGDSHVGTNDAMDEVHMWRDTYSADMVCLLEDEPNTGGLGWLLTSENGRPDYAFCLARVQQSDWTYTVVHEWGHNMGCSHSKTQISGPWEAVDLFSYSAGWQWDDFYAEAVYEGDCVGYCSIMTYEDFDHDGKREYVRVPHFSNPAISYQSQAEENPTGDAADGDNARTIREVRYAVADYRISDTAITQLPSSNSFEQAYIPWRYYEGGTEWFRDDGSDGNLNTAVSGGSSGTTVAHTGNYFLMFDAAHEEGSTAFLDAAFDLINYSETVIEYWYYMQSFSSSWMGSLSLQVSTNSGSSWADLWTRSGNQGAGWQLAQVDLGLYDGMTNVQIRIRADIGSSWSYTYICLDDVSVNGTLIPDVDADGLPNEWEELYFGGVTNADPKAISSNGVNTLIEAYVSGLNPTNPTSFFELSNDSNSLQWDAVTGRVYRIYWTSNLLSNFQSVETNDTGSFTDAVHEASDKGFYRIDVELAP